MAAIDLDLIQRAFGALLDRAALAVESAGYSLDDSITERFIRIRASNGDSVEVEAGFLSDRARFEAQCRDILRQADLADLASGACVLEEIIVRTCLEAC